MKKNIGYFLIGIGVAVVLVLGASMFYRASEASRKDKQIREQINQGIREDGGLNNQINSFVKNSLGFDVTGYDLTTLNDEPISFDGVSIIKIANTNCPACRQSVPTVNQLREEYRVYSMFSRNTLDEIQDYYQEGFDPTSIIVSLNNEYLEKFVSDLNAQFVPIFLFIKDGEVFNALVGAPDYDIAIDILNNFDN